MGSIFDLIGPPAPPPAAPDDAQAFDSLLQPPTCSDPVADQEPNASRPANGLPPVDGRPVPASESSFPEAAADPSGDSHDDSEPHREVESHEPAPPSGEAPQKEEVSPPNQNSSQAADEVVIESLAALSALNSAPKLPNADETKIEEPTEPSIAPDKQKTPGVQPTAVQIGASPPRKPSVQTDLSDRPLPEGAHEINGRLRAGSAAGPSVTAGKTIVVDPLGVKVVTESSISSEPGASLTPDDPPKAEIAARGDERSHERSHDAQFRTSNLESVAAASPGPDATPALPLAIGAAPAVASNLPVADAPQNVSDANSARASVTISPPQRPRLPAELLTQTTSGTGRRSSVEVDATRLLTRVARAFTAARQRDVEVHLRLSPPELGSLRLDVRVQDGTLVARLQTETEEARAAIIDNLPALRDRLADQGVRIERFDVDLMQQQSGGMPDQPGSRQQDLPAAPLRTIPPPRMQSAAPVSPVSSNPVVSIADGLNVIV
jgi:flagellar hook-length control protein FliK